MSDLDPDDISKALFHFNSGVRQLMQPLRLYGQEAYVMQAEQEIIKLAWHLHWVLEGVDEPFEVEDLHW